jgi:hypothetical protein
MRAIVIDEGGAPRPADVPEPVDGVRVLACGLCGSDVEKLTPAHAGRVLGHEVVAAVDGRRVALVHHAPCGTCDRCRAGHETTCERFAMATIRPGGFAGRGAPPSSMTIARIAPHASACARSSLRSDAQELPLLGLELVFRDDPLRLQPGKRLELRRIVRLGGRGRCVLCLRCDLLVVRSLILRRVLLILAMPYRSGRPCDDRRGRRSADEPGPSPSHHRLLLS